MLFMQNASIVPDKESLVASTKHFLDIGISL